MNAKILKHELFFLFTLTVITTLIFYYRDSLPDNYFSISSTSNHGFFSYYLISFFSQINYYSGVWVLLPFLVFTLFYVFIFSKRHDWIDCLNLVSLILASGLMVYYIKPSFLGLGLNQLLMNLFSPFMAFTVWIVSCFAFLWGAFRGNLVVGLREAIGGVKGIRIGEKPVAFGGALYEKICQFKGRVLRSFEKNKPLLIEQYSSDENEVVGEMAEDVLEKVGFVENEKSKPGLILAEKNGEKNSEEDDEKYANESRVGESLKKPERHFSKCSDDRYFDLVRAAGSKNTEHKFVQPEDKYFLDIINKLQVKLGEFKIQGRIINVLKGPVVDTFEWELGVGEKVSRLTVTSEDLSLALSGSPIRMVYPMKGRTTVGIEVPRNPRDFIFLEEIINSKDYIHTTHQLPLAMGKDAFGEPVVVDLAAMPHMLVAGSTGAGKSVFINSILVSLLIKRSPNQMKLILIDPKQLELALYAKLPHLIMPVITEAKKTATALLWACQEMERRYSIMSEFGVRNIEGFNHKLKRTDGVGKERISKFYEDPRADGLELPYLVIIIDEFADLILTQKGKEIETHVCRLAAKARAAGIHLILATQRPSVDVITGLIKSNFPTRVSFRVTSSTDSRTILNAMGAEKLLGKGDMLYKQGVETTRIHSAFVEEEEIEALTEQLADMAPTFNDKIIEFLENEGEEDLGPLSSRESDELNEKDDKYEEAVRVVVEHRTASASLLQRRLGVGYNRAANLIEEMEMKGVVGPAQGSKPRKVLMGSESSI